MRQIESEEVIRAKRKRQQAVLGVFMIVLLLGSTAGYAVSLLSSESVSVDGSNGKPFFDGVSWIVPYAGVQFALQASPEEASAVPFEGLFNPSNYYGPVVYIDAENEVIKQKLGGVIGLLAPRVQEACYGSCEQPDLPEKQCDEPLVVWREANTRRIYTDASCVFIEGDYVAVDAFLYRLLGHI